jgi:hypothetical protein
MNKFNTTNCAYIFTLIELDLVNLVSDLSANSDLLVGIILRDELVVRLVVDVLVLDPL